MFDDCHCPCLLPSPRPPRDLVPLAVRCLDCRHEFTVQRSRAFVLQQSQRLYMTARTMQCPRCGSWTLTCWQAA